MTLCTQAYEQPKGCASSTFWKPEEYCNLESEDVTREALRSFPSYHAAIAAYWYVFYSGRIVKNQYYEGFSAHSPHET